MRETRRVFELDADACLALEYTFRVLVDATKIEHEVQEELYCKGRYEIELIVRQFKEGK